MNRRNVWLLSSTCAAALLLSVDVGSAQTKLARSHPGWMILNPNSSMPTAKPPSNRATPGQHRMHTFLDVLLLPDSVRAHKNSPLATGAPPFAGTLVETPASLGCVYQLGTGGKSVGCNPNSVTKVISGGSSTAPTVAIVDAYDYGSATAHSDLAAFSSQFGLPSPNLTVIYGTGHPSAGCTNGAAPPSITSSSTAFGWALEEALDIEAVHSMAPNAHIYLVEANSSFSTDLYNAVQVATACIAAAGNGMQSHSWGRTEFTGETANDAIFSTTAHVNYLVSAGDEPFNYYPCASPNVICVGGTSISRNPTTGFIQSEQPWENVFGSGTGGGQSAFESRPTYQASLSSTVGNTRGMPDFTAAADPYAGGMWVYSSVNFSGFPLCSSNWCAVGGTSEASPLLAGILDFAGWIYGTTPKALGGPSGYYTQGVTGGLTPYFTNVNGGLCGAFVYNSGFYYSWGAWDPQNEEAVSGKNYNLCAGWGAPKDSGKPN